MELDTSLQGESSAASVKQSFISADSKKKKKKESSKVERYTVLHFKLIMHLLITNN